MYDDEAELFSCFFVEACDVFFSAVCIGFDDD